MRAFYFALDTIHVESNGNKIRIRLICNNPASHFENQFYLSKYVKFEVLTSMTTKTSVFGGVTSYSAGSSSMFQRNMLLLSSG